MTDPRVYKEEFKQFRGIVPLQRSTFGKLAQKVWTYYDFGPRDRIPLVCLPGNAGTAEAFFKQVMALSNKGHRVISVQHAPYLTWGALLKGLDLLLDKLQVPKCHLLGEGLGGYTAQCYAQCRSTRVCSLILVNTYCDLHSFVESSPWSSVLGWMPDSLMRKFLVSDFTIPERTDDNITAYQFIRAFSHTLSTEDLVSRLTLQYLNGPLVPSDFPIPSEHISIIESSLPIAIPERLLLEVSKFYPNSTTHTIDNAKEFPYLSHAELFNQIIENHLIQHNARYLNGSPISNPVQPQLQSSSSTPKDKIDDHEVPISSKHSLVPNSNGNHVASSTSSDRSSPQADPLSTPSSSST